MNGFYHFDMDVVKKVCQYGAKCYRKNKDHLSEYHHPSETSDNGSGLSDKPSHPFTRTRNSRQGRAKENEKQATDLTHKKTPGKRRQTTQGKAESKKVSAAKRVKTSNGKTPGRGKTDELEKGQGSGNRSSDESDTDDNDVKSHSWTYIKVADAPEADLSKTDPLKNACGEDRIKHYYSVDMPEDFYSFFKFCESLSEDKPLTALKCFGLTLVGPYDVLSGASINVRDKEMVLCHWRYFYDMPEFQTVLASESGFHMGYWRDDPKEMPVFVASNNAKDCLFKVEGENMFGAVHQYLTDFVKTCDPFSKTKVGKIQNSLKKWAEENKFVLDKSTPRIKARNRKVNSKTFHGVGIVVPLQKKTDVGYRPLIETDAKIKKMCKLVMDADTEAERESLMGNLQPLITLADIANDECDFGNSLELGIDLFCMGSPVFDTAVEHLLTTAYTLLGRSVFADVIRVHLKNRRNDTNLSVL